ncbi:MAG: peptidylprolyl isomerase [Bacteroidota bacterium]
MIPKKVEAKEPDSINDKNTVEFLTKYGRLNPETKVLIKTRYGNIKIKLYNDTPLHRANFIFLTNVGYFDTTCFYRVVPDFIIQGGNSERIKTQVYKHRYKRYKLPAEFKPNRKHKYGALAAARDWENNPRKKSTAFEFYIVQNKKGAHHLDGEHTVFGEVISGFSVVDKIANEKAGGDEWPLTDVFMDLEVLQ